MEVKIPCAGFARPLKFIDFNKLDISNLKTKCNLGLALSLCKPLIEQMAGRVNLQGNAETGTTININFNLSCMVKDLNLQNNESNF